MNRGGNILFSGVGGQGILLASELTAQAVLAAGFDAKKSEVHGMAQRNGSVEAHLRYSKKVYSPLIEPRICKCGSCYRTFGIHQDIQKLFSSCSCFIHI